LEQIKQFSKLIKYIQLQYIPKMQTDESEYILFFCKILEVHTVGIVLTSVNQQILLIFSVFHFSQ